MAWDLIIGRVGVVEYLNFRRSVIYRFARYLTNIVEYTGIAHLAGFPVDREFKVFEFLCGIDNVPIRSLTGFFIRSCKDLHSIIFNFPVLGHRSPVTLAPACEILAIE